MGGRLADPPVVLGGAAVLLGWLVWVLQARGERDQGGGRLHLPPGHQRGLPPLRGVGPPARRPPQRQRAAVRPHEQEEGAKGQVRRAGTVRQAGRLSHILLLLLVCLSVLCLVRAGQSVSQSVGDVRRVVVVQ